ncbi:MAG: class I SAM-dependent methyltransferase [Phycisphaerae bacterium]
MTEIKNEQQINNDEQMEAYSQAVQSGLYAKKSGLVGKYDNVRLYWEDELMRIFMRPHLQKLIEHSQSEMRRLRILDLGCGSADGYELLSRVRHRDSSLRDDEVDLLTPDVLGLYKGIELNTDLMEQARGIYGDNPKMVFQQGDFSDGLPLSEDEKPYDLYFTSYGTCSHLNDDEQAVKLLADIARRADKYCIIVCDWLGRWSYEWQSLWTNDFDRLRNMDYVVSYIYNEQERRKRRDELQHLTLRLMSRPEAEEIIAEASHRAGVQIRPAKFFDRSVLTGRHMDTGDYNPHAQPIRQAVNMLHEANIRTDFDDLLVNYVPKQGFEELNDFMEHLTVCWNTLVQYVDELLHRYDERERQFAGGAPDIPENCPEPLRSMMQRMRMVVEGIGWLGIGLPREHIIEPQLGYALRHLVSSLQRGMGCGHGLVGILEVDKR